MGSGIRSYFIVWNNPEYIIVRDKISGEEIEKLPSELNGLSPQQICDSVLQLWISSGKNRSGWVGYCISSAGLHHLHMILESKSTIEFTALKKVFPRAHLEPTRGSKKEVDDYINKRGKYEEKGEVVVCFSTVGEIRGNQGKRSDLIKIQEELDSGLKPYQIIGSDFKRQRYAQFIKSAYLSKRENECPTQRDVRVVWHYGASGTGKSFSYLKTCEKFGRHEVYKIVRDLCKGRFDDYQGEKVLFLDEIKPCYVDWVDLLNCLDTYLYYPSARYKNSVSLWEEVHVTSIYSPRQFWEEMIPLDKRKLEPFEQLGRRITEIIRHTKDHQGNYKQEKVEEWLTDSEVITDTKLLPFT